MAQNENLTIEWSCDFICMMRCDSCQDRSIAKLSNFEFLEKKADSYVNGWGQKQSPQFDW